MYINIIYIRWKHFSLSQHTNVLLTFKQKVLNYLSPDIHNRSFTLTKYKTLVNLYKINYITSEWILLINYFNNGFIKSYLTFQQWRSNICTTILTQKLLKLCTRIVLKCFSNLIKMYYIHKFYYKYVLSEISVQKRFTVLEVSKVSYILLYSFIWYFIILV